MVAAREPRIVELRADVHRITIGGGKTDIAARLKAAVAGGRGQLVDLEPVAGKAAVDDHVRQPRAIGLIFIGHATPADPTVEAGVEDAATEISGDGDRPADTLVGHADEREQRFGRAVVADAAEI